MITLLIMLVIGIQHHLLSCTTHLVQDQDARRQLLALKHH